jgi:hypothetical protein
MSFHSAIQLLARFAMPRAQLAAITLVAVLQKTPAAFRALSIPAQSVEPTARILQKLTLTAASLGSYHAMTGATSAVYSTAPDPPFAFERGESVTIAFGVSQTETHAQSWEVSGDVPPGLAVSGTLGEPLSDDGVFNAQFGQISGVPTEAGIFTFYLKPWKFRDAQGPTAEAFELSITVTSPAAHTLETPQVTIQTAPDHFIVSWSVETGQTYRLQTTDNPLDEDSWTDFPANFDTVDFRQTAIIAKAGAPSPLLLRVATQPAD